MHLKYFSFEFISPSCVFALSLCISVWVAMLAKTLSVYIWYIEQEGEYKAKCLGRLNMHAKVTSALPSVQYRQWVPACQAAQLVLLLQCRRVVHAYPFHLFRHVRPWCHCHRPAVPPAPAVLVLRAHPWVQPDRVHLCDPGRERERKRECETCVK